MRLILSEKDLFFYNDTIKPQFIHRIPAVRMWTIDEWNILHPHVHIKKEDNYKRLAHSPNNKLDLLYTPELVV